jgi:predicted MPP superfamily phosphohydrolase
MILNTQHLTPLKGKDHADVCFIGDIHYGHPQSLLEKVKELLTWCLKTKTHIFLMGDLIESGLTTSVGDSVYQQKLNPQEQVEAVTEMLRPVRHLILGSLAGNHEYRIKKNTSIDVMKNMCRELQIPYLGYAGWNLLYVGKESYSVYTYHGASGSK